jgi:hypothetical protein
MNKSILSLFALLSLYCTVAAQIPTNGLVVYFPFNGNAKDSSGNGQHGTASNIVHAKDRFGNANSAYFFKGATNSYVQFPTTKVLLNKFTWSLWANLAALPPSGEIRMALDVGGQAGDQSINIQNNYLGSTGWGGGGYNTVSPDFPLQQRTNPNDSTWYHIVYTRDSAKVLVCKISALWPQQYQGFCRFEKQHEFPVLRHY